MRRLALVLGGLAAGLLVALVAVVIVVLTGGGGIDEEAYRQQVRPLILQWQNNIGLSTFTCGAGDPFTEQSPDIFGGKVMALSQIHQDLEALETPERYRPGVEAMGAIATELETVEINRNELLLALQGMQLFNADVALADLPPTEANVSWFVRATGAFETWGADFRRWSDFIDCTLPEEPQRVDELGGYMRQMEIDAQELKRLRSEGPPEMVEAFAPMLNGIEIATQVFARLSRALEHQVVVEQVFADVIAGE